MSTLWSRGLLAAALVATLPGAALGQNTPVTPEGTTWYLTAYADDGTASVPFYAGATLELQDGTASGSTGCNTFTGPYVLEGDGLDLEEPVAVTRAACADELLSRVEQGYLAALPQVATWSIVDDRLTLDGADGSTLLEFEQPFVSVTRSGMADLVGLIGEQRADIAELEARIERAGERIDNIRIGTLRDRIKTLEAEVARLRQSASASSNANRNTGSAYTAAEKVLLKAIPAKVKRTCQPLRAGLPGGTVAAVACDGSRSVVAEQAYYLMEWSDAVATLRAVASSKGVPNRNPRCHAQRAGWIHHGANLGAEACWSEDGTANYRLVTNATDCKQLNVAGTRLKQPAIYLAMEGVNDQLEPVRAAGLAYTDAGYFIMNGEAGRPIAAPGERNSASCRARLDAAGGL